MRFLLVTEEESQASPLWSSEDDPHLLAGLKIYQGQVTRREVAEALGYGYRLARDALDL